MVSDSPSARAVRLKVDGGRTHLIIRSDNLRCANAEEFPLGIEEEYFLADAETYEAAIRTPNDLFETATWSTGGHVSREALQAQIEVATNVHTSVKDAAEELKFLRREVSKIAGQYGLCILASGTHPTAAWHRSVPSPKARYEEMADDLRILAQRNMLCGMHVHVQLPDPARRFEIMCAMIPYIPVFLALSTSSPFWNSRDTGLKGYRLAAYDELPRTGIPELFARQEDYESYVEALKQSGAIPDATYIWWAMRPSSRHPTLELRAPDSCTRAQDAIAIASLYRVLARHLYHKPRHSLTTTPLMRAIAIENKWRAQRFGVNCQFATQSGPISVKDVVANLIRTTTPDAVALGCLSEIQHCRRIVDEGSSADEQLRMFQTSSNKGDALKAVAAWIARTTIGDDAENLFSRAS